VFIIEVKPEITNNKNVIINLPEYVSNIATEFTVYLTQVFNGTHVPLASSEVDNNKFNIIINIFF